MPSIPTSLVFVVLAAAWLAVLVPMFARRRHPVPRIEDGGAGFHVLRRAITRRRPNFGRTAYQDDGQDEEFDDSGHENDEFFDTPGVSESVVEVRDDDFDDEEQPTRELFLSGTIGRGSTRWNPDERSDPRPAGSTPATFHSAAGAPVLVDDDVEERRVGGHPVETDYSRRPGRIDYDEAGSDDVHYRPVPVRRGRGGFDPEAAEAVRAYRFHRRRRLVLVLLVLILGFSAAAYFLKPLLWAGTAVSVLVLIGYLGYLNRTVRIERNVRQRRLAKLQRARQIRPEYHPHHIEGAAASHVPPAAYYPGRSVVEQDDEDPSFDELEQYQPITYRRAAGQ